jgi:hypothetical protein
MWRSIVVLVAALLVGGCIGLRAPVQPVDLPQERALVQAKSRLVVDRVLGLAGRAAIAKLPHASCSGCDAVLGSITRQLFWAHVRG